MKRFSAALLAFILLLCVIPISAFGDSYSFVVAEGDLALHSEIVPSRYDDEYYVSNGDVLYYLGESRSYSGYEWYAVLYDGAAVWICSRYATLYSNRSGGYIRSYAYLYSDLWNQQSYICRLNPSDYVRFTGFNWNLDAKLWLHVTFNGMSGYIPADCVQFDGNYSPSSSQSQYVYATLTENKMATRSGPSTKYYETGSYFGRGTSVKLYSRVYDSVNEIWWVQAEANENGRLRRVYTGSWRFANLNVYSLSEEYCIASGRMNGSCTLRYGPGNEYDTYDTAIGSGASFSAYAYENGWVQIECTINGVRYRGWVPQSLTNQ